jgi:hypothetical protein
MGDPWNNNRQIGIIVNTERLFSEALIESLWTAVQELPVDYMLVLSGDSGKGTFYICIRKCSEVAGFAPDRRTLESFGFT